MMPFGGPARLAGAPGCSMPSRSPLINRESQWSGWVFPVLFCAVLVGALLWPATLVLPPYLVLQGLFRSVTYPLLNGDQSRGFPHPPNIYFIILTPVAIGLLIVAQRALMRRFRRRMYLGRAAAAFGLLVLVMYALNSKVQGGLGIPLALLYSAGLLALCWEAQRADWARRLLESAVWVGVGFLVSSGIVISLGPGETRFELQRLHGLYGYLWMAAVCAYLIAHITYYEAKRETSSRNWGFVATAMLTAAAMTGVARLHGGGETIASGLWPHVITGAAAAGALAVHVGRSWRKRGLHVQLGPGHASGVFVLGCVVLGVFLPVLPAAFGRWASAAGTAGASGVDKLRASPGAAVTASGPNRGLLPLELVSIGEGARSCGKTGGCHVDIQAQWERSAHRFSANAAYRNTVRLLVQEAGVARARLCAGCHDPVPLLTGQIVDGADYPFEHSEGVTCVVCHSMQPGTEARNGHYTVAPSSTFHGTVKDPFTAYMMIELYRGEHRADFFGKSIADNSTCAPCHNLTSEHLVLRRTFDEWSEGPFGPHSPNAKSCTGCHMPPVGDSYLGFFTLHDHRMPAANVALAGLRGESTEAERTFIAGALDLQLSIGRPTAEEFEIRARLTNQHGAHVFPTAPRDLLDYWFEVRFEGDDGSTSWRRLDTVGLFPETLISDDGKTLVRHEIWRAVDKHGPEGISPGETREYVYPLPSFPPGVERVSVRLMHRRYQDAFLDFLGPHTDGLNTEPIEVLRRTTGWPRAEQMSAR
jgi:cytochrome c554/c'-like protein